MSDYLFDDGSLESKVLQHEIKAQVVKVDKYDLAKWLSNIDIKEVTKVYLHFCSSDLIKKDVDIRTDVQEALHKYPNLRIILQYENMDRRSLENRAREYGIDNNERLHNLSVALSKVGEPKINAILDEEYINKFNKEHPSATIDQILEVNKDKIKTIDYGKFTVGGNDTAVAAAAAPKEDNFTDKSNWFKDKRRRKKDV